MLSKTGSVLFISLDFYAMSFLLLNLFSFFKSKHAVEKILLIEMMDSVDLRDGRQFYPGDLFP